MVCASLVVDRRDAQRHVVQGFDPHAAKAGHHDRARTIGSRRAPMTISSARCGLLLNERRARAETAIEVLERLVDGRRVSKT